MEPTVRVNSENLAIELFELSRLLNRFEERQEPLRTISLCRQEWILGEIYT